MNGFHIRAIPTKYRGRLYRSRLEARWAAFFDLLEITHEYEPFEVGGWMPDFALIGEDEVTVLVEVKPTLCFDEAAAAKMITACGRNDEGFCTETLLLMGLKPFWTGRSPGNPVNIGWHLHQTKTHISGVWVESPLAWVSHHETPRFVADLLDFGLPDEPQGFNGLLNHSCGPGTNEHLDYQEHTMQLWAEATNKVQWLGKETER